MTRSSGVSSGVGLVVVITFMFVFAIVYSKLNLHWGTTITFIIGIVVGSVGSIIIEKRSRKITSNEFAMLLLVCGAIVGISTILALLV